MSYAASSTDSQAHGAVRGQSVRHHDPESAARALAAEERARVDKERREQHQSARVYALGRILLAALFLVSAGYKALHLEQLQDALAPLLYNPVLLPLGSITVEAVGGLLLLLGYRVKWAATGLAGYLLAVTVLVPPALRFEHAVAIANLGFIGGLLLLAAHGAGRWSLEKQLGRRSADSSER